MKPYSAGSSILDVILKAVKAAAMRWLKDNAATAAFLSYLEIKAENMHNKAAEDAQAKAQLHLQRAQEIADSRKEADKWNDDTL